jgi:hypothetical protein
MSANDLEHNLQTEIFVLSSEDVANTDHLDI